MPASKKPNYWKWGIIAAIAVALFLLGRGCGITSVEKQAGTVKTVTKDSIVFQDRPVPYKVDSLVYVKGKDGKTIYDTLYGAPEVIFGDTAAILKRFNEVAYYRDVRDTGRAKITIEDTLHRNRITGRSVKVVFTDTVTTNTIVLKPPRRIVLSVKASVLGNIRSPFFGQGAGLNLKLPSEGTWEVQVFNVNGHRPMFMVSKSWPIRLTGKK